MTLSEASRGDGPEGSADQGRQVASRAAEILDGVRPDRGDGDRLVDAFDHLSRQRQTLWGDPLDAVLGQVRAEADSPAGPGARTAALAGLTALEALAAAPGPGQGFQAWLKAAARRAGQVYPSMDGRREAFLGVSLRAMALYCRECSNPEAAEHFDEALRHAGTLWGRMRVERHHRALTEAWREMDLSDRAFQPSGSPAVGEIRREGGRLIVGGVDLPIRK